MQRIRPKDTRPELVVRRALQLLGYRFRLHRKGLPGKPDIVLLRWRRIILVHGCFWHQHPRCKLAVKPSTNHAFWLENLDANVRRDATQIALLRDLGWDVLVVWECETKNQEILLQRLEEFFSNYSGDA